MEIVLDLNVMLLCIKKRWQVEESLFTLDILQ